MYLESVKALPFVYFRSRGESSHNAHHNHYHDDDTASDINYSDHTKEEERGEEEKWEYAVLHMEHIQYYTLGPKNHVPTVHKRT